MENPIDRIVLNAYGVSDDTAELITIDTIHPIGDEYDLYNDIEIYLTLGSSKEITACLTSKQVDALIKALQIMHQTSYIN